MDFLARTIRLLSITLKRLYLAPPNLVTCSFYLLDTIQQNFSKINSPGGLLQLFFLNETSLKIEHMNVLFRLKTMEMQRRV